jgi:CRP/FNR family transcriptional regulator, cyclic AMP receptor protein
MTKEDLLSRVSIFSHMKKRDLKRIVGHATFREFHAGEVIIHEGEYDNSLFVIVSGVVQAFKGLGGNNEKDLGILGPGSYFGEIALIDNLPRSASVVAKEDAQVLCLEQLDLHQEIEKSSPMAIEMMQMLSLRIRANEKFIKNTLGKFLPICSNCKKIREDNGSWTAIEEFIRDRSETEFSHGLCPDCAKSLYPEFYKGDGH